MYNHNKAQQNKNRVHISWDILYLKSADGFHLQIDGLVQDCSNASALPIE